MGADLRRTGAGTYVSTSPEATIELGRILGTLLGADDLLILTGDLGAGKTQLTKGVARGMGVADEVTSPTFNIEVTHEGAETDLHHFDLYRLDDASQLGDAGVYDALDGDGPCLVEWGEAFADELGDERVDVTLERLDDEVAANVEPPRSITFEPHGTEATRLVLSLDAAFDATICKES
ncbi:MAG: tRNA (adenosine(37)-N6)-threonylcarbamoyltransferase complex ATPase subunit type 1 TsaE [Atopobiaceae bacterium]|jgi:tRNA threonylcarbamoyladenosine biosynthesis protein TsaE|nr:tRNA (adenosine(37)-N6)-threonylcarbamoyltransferase complex ATPase subunit type 1 TsaE [Atopobiaceae bacterium]MCH4179962.1 tRNA (adenosine(37)-N6)-threonylcarbamoyltransferase complex ATPase subunit type 1 TsaE [Atopobiaceae bacterium]MCH4213713.1 tRNA (adenosine(37)-N6)-threonylcarbamoyltransferase complex ATPase subunit type 1 TsaE [Atopobiaceae bacterium]MCH4230058.1 tRNA (adenosine(37)-N6)-threonylcarbamoyltransferase complex ATPase subunit type 1 TsaE [Atopobiaceae bacterium]MCH427593